MRGIYEATWGRVVAAGYDAGLARAEASGLAALRARVVGAARGTVLELGAGTGLNLTHYGSGVSELVLVEPGPHMARRLRARVARVARGEAPAPARVLAAGAERLPLPDASVDSAVATLVLCTVGDPAAALREVARVLRPGGRLHFLEHVRSPERRAARLQDLAAPAWRLLADGCHPNRDTLATLTASPLAVGAVERERFPRGGPIVRPLILGWARAPE